jgi:hypothetical protein
MAVNFLIRANSGGRLPSRRSVVVACPARVTTAVAEAVALDRRIVAITAHPETFAGGMATR